MARTYFLEDKNDLKMKLVATIRSDGMPEFHRACIQEIAREVCEKAYPAPGDEDLKKSKNSDIMFWLSVNKRGNEGLDHLCQSIESLAAEWLQFDQLKEGVKC